MWRTFTSLLASCLLGSWLVSLLTPLFSLTSLLPLHPSLYIFSLGFLPGLILPYYRPNSFFIDQ